MIGKFESQIAKQLNKGRKNSDIVRRLLSDIHVANYTYDDKLSILKFAYSSGLKSQVIRALREWPDKEKTFPWEIGLEIFSSCKTVLSNAESETLIQFLKSKRLHPPISENYKKIHDSFEEYHSSYIDHLNFKSSKFLKLMWDKLFFLQQKGILNEEINTIKQLLKYDSENPKLRKHLKKVKKLKDSKTNVTKVKITPPEPLAKTVVEKSRLIQKKVEPQEEKEEPSSSLPSLPTIPDQSEHSSFNTEDFMPEVPQSITSGAFSDLTKFTGEVDISLLPEEMTSPNAVVEFKETNTFESPKALDTPPPISQPGVEQKPQKVATPKGLEYSIDNEFSRPFEELTQYEKTFCQGNLEHAQKTLTAGHFRYFDLAFHFYSINAFQFSLKCIELAPEGQTKNYLKVQYLYLARRYLETIHFAQELIKETKVDLPLIYHCLFYQAESFWELGKAQEAIECMQLLVREAPDFQSCEVILTSWRRSLR